MEDDVFDVAKMKMPHTGPRLAPSVRRGRGRSRKGPICFPIIVCSNI